MPGWSQTSPMALWVGVFNAPGWDQKMNSNTWFINGQSPLTAGLTTIPEPDWPAGSSTLEVQIRPFTAHAPDGSVIAFAGVERFAVPDDATSFVWLDTAGALHADPAFPALVTGGAFLPIAAVTTAGGVVVGISCMRAVLPFVNYDLDNLYLALAGGTLAGRLGLPGTGLGLAPGNGPAVPADGDVWNDTAYGTVVLNLRGLKRVPVGVGWSQTAALAVASATADGTLLGAGRGSKTIPANELAQAGSLASVKLFGRFTGGGAATVEIKLKLNGVTLATTGAVTPAALANAGVRVEAQLAARAAGSMIGAGVATIGGVAYHLVGTAQTFDPTVGLPLDLTVGWPGGVDAGGSMTSEVASITLGG